MALRAAPARWLWRALAAPGALRVVPPPPRAAASAPALPPARPRCTGTGTGTGGHGPEREGPRRRVLVVRVTSPLAWLRTRFYYLLIRLYFDQEFSVEEFTRGAKQVGDGLGAAVFGSGGEAPGGLLCAFQCLKGAHKKDGDT